jgi:hypothetical protein
LKLRVAKIERALMLAELHLDGLKTHTTIKKEKCAIYNTPYDHKVRIALSAVRSARDILRNDIGHKQRTITTRGGPANRHGLWECTPKKTTGGWKCGFDLPAPKKNLVVTELTWYAENIRSNNMSVGDSIEKLEEQKIPDLTGFSTAQTKRFIR